MDSFYSSDNTLVKLKKSRKSRNPYKQLTDEEAAIVSRSDEIICSSLDTLHPDKLLDLSRYVPYERIEPHLRHGLLAESIFQKQLKLDEVRYDDLRRPERQERRQRASVQAYVDLVRDGVFDASVLAPLGDNQPAPSAENSRGRPSNELKTMFRLVLLGCRFRLSDQSLYEWACESPTVRRFVGITDIRHIPSPKTIWSYRDAWAQHNSLRKVFDESLQFCLDLLPDISSQIGKCSIVDGTFVDAPKRHVSAAVHQQIIDGVDPVDIFENPAERRQRDVDARHTKKNNLPYFGYKTHTKACMVSKLITDLFVTAANVHDSQAVDKLITSADKGTMVLGDSAYNGQKQRDYVESVGAEPLFMEKPTVIKKLLDDPFELFQRKGRLLLEQNAMISKHRVRVEHIFGHIQVSFGGSFVRSVSFPRANAHQMLTACCYNAERTRYLLSEQDVKT